MRWICTITLIITSNYKHWSVNTHDAFFYLSSQVCGDYQLRSLHCKQNKSIFLSQADHVRAPHIHSAPSLYRHYYCSLQPHRLNTPLVIWSALQIFISVYSPLSQHFHSLSLLPSRQLVQDTPTCFGLDFPPYLPFLRIFCSARLFLRSTKKQMEKLSREP